MGLDSEYQSSNDQGLSLLKCCYLDSFVFFSEGKCEEGTTEVFSDINLVEHSGVGACDPG